MPFLAFDFQDPYYLIIAASVVIILSFFFSALAKRTNIPSVLMLILLGIVLQSVITRMGITTDRFQGALELLGIVGLIMIVLEAALELELKREKLIPIVKAMGMALVSLILSAWAAAVILEYMIPELTTQQAWIYATPLSILSSAIIIPSVGGLHPKKKEFHIYESTFSDILGIMMFYFLSGQAESGDHGGGASGFFINILLTIGISLVASYAIILIFQNIRSHVKLFLLISVLLLLYSIGKKMHLSSLLIILIFGLMVANMRLFFQGPLAGWLDEKKAHGIYEGLHVVTIETAFVVRTFFFVIFGVTIALSSLYSLRVAMIASLILVSIYLLRWILLKIFVGRDIIPELFIAPRGLITILLFYAIPETLKTDIFDPGILLFIILGTSLIMTGGMIYEKGRSSRALRAIESKPVGYTRWKAPTID